MDLHAIKSSLLMQDDIPLVFLSLVLLKIKTISLLVFGLNQLFRLQQGNFLYLMNLN